MTEKSQEKYKAEIDSILKTIDTAQYKETSLVTRSSELPAKAAQYYNPYELVDIYSGPLINTMKAYYGQVVPNSPETEEKYRLTAEKTIRDAFNYQADAGIFRRIAIPFGTGALLTVVTVLHTAVAAADLMGGGLGLAGISISYALFKKAMKDNTEVENMFELERLALANNTDPTKLKGNKAIYKRTERKIKKIIAGKKDMPKPFSQP
ncbi:MAG: hypothetical protein PHE27_05945 [Alphaproteobacteria bacterium]|nr:hypothetical protein [Alphaproteobacteria bacterium]